MSTPDDSRERAANLMLERFRAILADVSCAPYSFIVGMADAPYLQVGADLPCNATGVMEQQRGRKWLLSQWMTESEVVQTALMAALAFEEHELRERFAWQGRAIYDGHYSVRQLWELRGTKGWSDYRPKPPAAPITPPCIGCGRPVPAGVLACPECAPYVEAQS